uniref:NADH-ubiquinone oxidoreductase chain 2 n=1 Tax=Branchiostoma floridae TaxID=7739 RepID=C6L3N6_BRAFL|nr:NADH dehydrogenase subunit 2 [Branchiostoma floridae]
MSPYISPLFSITMIMSVMLISSSGHWVFMWLGLELGTLAFIPILVWWHSSLEVEATVKYFIVQAMAATVFFLGGMVSLSGDFMGGVNQLMGNIGDMMIMLAVVTKLGLAPFHYWVVDVVQGLNYIPGAVLLTWQKVPGLAVLTQLATCNNSSMLLLFGMVSALVGGLGGLGQTQMRKLLAFSSISHLGWLVVGCVAGSLLGLSYFTLYVVLSIPLFSILHMLNGGHLNQLRTGLMFNPLMSVLLGVGFLSLGGLPPFFGFFGKWLLLTHFVGQLLLGVSVVLITGTLISLFYYLRVSYLCIVVLGPQQIMSGLNWRKMQLSGLMSGLLVLNMLGLFLVGGASCLPK